MQAGSSNRQTYGYDGFGNLTSTTSWVNGSGTTRTTAVVGTTNRLSAAGYDAAGNQTTWGTYAYTWDLMGLMKAYQGSGTMSNLETNLEYNLKIAPSDGGFVVSGSHTAFPSLEIWVYEDSKEPKAIYVYDAPADDFGEGFVDINRMVHIQ